MTVGKVVQGSVYKGLDLSVLYKYRTKPTMTTIFKQLQKLEPVAFGGFSELFVLGGNAVKLIEDQDYLGTLEESYRQNLAAEAGLAPQSPCCC